jgi:hypothetical protein
VPTHISVSVRAKPTTAKGQAFEMFASFFMASLNGYSIVDGAYCCFVSFIFHVGFVLVGKWFRPNLGDSANALRT